MQKKIGLEWLGGFFDGEGCFSIQIRKDKDSRNNYRCHLGAKVNQTGKDSKETIEKCKQVLEKEGIDCNISKRNDKRKNRKDGWLLEVSKKKDFRLFIEKIEPYIFNKEYELIRIKEDILPLTKENKHTSKEGIIKLCKIKREIYDYKGMSEKERSKYNIEYFKEKWDIE